MNPHLSNRTALLLSAGGKSPVVDPSATLLPGATVVGDVKLGPQSSVWFGAVLRGDSGRIVVGCRSNIQDNCVLHGSVEIGNNVVVAHGALLHDCVVKDGAIVGMGALILGSVEIGEGSFIAAGSLVAPRTVVPSGVQMRGRPARIVGEVSDLGEAEWLVQGAEYYVGLSQGYRPSIDSGGDAAGADRDG